MDGISARDAAPGQAQVALLRKALDAGKANAAALLEVLPPPAAAPSPANGRVDLYL